MNKNAVRAKLLEQLMDLFTGMPDTGMEEGKEMPEGKEKGLEVEMLAVGKGKPMAGAMEKEEADEDDGMEKLRAMKC